MMHILPPRFHRIRYYGLLANGKSTLYIEQIRQVLASRHVSKTEAVAIESKEEFKGIRCSECKRGHMIPILVVRPYGIMMLKNFFLLFSYKESCDTS